MTEDTVEKFDACVLVADDQQAGREVMNAMLSRLGCRVDVVESGEEALSFYSNNDYDIIFMDIWMPGMNGFEAVEKIREIEQESGGEKHMPIIAASADAVGDNNKDMTATYMECHKHGIDDYLEKPVKLEKIEGLLVKWLRVGR